MKTVLKWGGIALAAIVLLLLVGGGTIYALTNSRMSQTYTVEPEPIIIPDDAEAVEWGKYIATTRGCRDCHGGDLAGRVVVEDPALGRFVSTNLTVGQGGVGSSYNDADWVRAIRHGVASDGLPLRFMQSKEYYHMDDEDLAALIAYIKSVEPMDNQVPEFQVGPVGRILMTTGELDILHAESVPTTPPAPMPERTVSVAYGGYVAVNCTGCHGPGFSGGPIPGGSPDWPPASNLTPGGPLADWTLEDFVNTMQTGVTPDERVLNPEAMPWPSLGQMNEMELEALWLYFSSLPPRETGNR